MGTFHYTCGVTQLPILEGEKVRCFIIMPDEHQMHGKENSPSYVCEYYNAPYLSFEGTYDGYGSVADVIEDWNTDLILADLRKNIMKLDDMPFTQGDRVCLIENGKPSQRVWFVDEAKGYLNRRKGEDTRQYKIHNPFENTHKTVTYDQITYNFRGENTDQIKDFSHALKLIVYDEYQFVAHNCHTHLKSRMHPALFMVRENVWQAIMDTEWEHFRYGKFNKRNNKKLIAETVERIANDFTPLNKEDYDDPMDMVMATMKQLRTLEDEHKNLIIQFLGNTFGNSNGDYCYEYREIAKNAGYANDKDRIDDLATRFMDQVMFIKAMDYTRRQFMPQSGMGSQDSLCEFYRTINEVMIPEMEKISKYWDDEEDYEGDD